MTWLRNRFSIRLDRQRKQLIITEYGKKATGVMTISLRGIHYTETSTEN